MLSPALTSHCELPNCRNVPAGKQAYFPGVFAGMHRARFCEFSHPTTQEPSQGYAIYAFLPFPRSEQKDRFSPWFDSHMNAFHLSEEEKA